MAKTDHGLRNFLVARLNVRDLWIEVHPVTGFLREAVWLRYLTVVCVAVVCVFSWYVYTDGGIRTYLPAQRFHFWGDTDYIYTGGYTFRKADRGISLPQGCESHALAREYREDPMYEVTCAGVTVFYIDNGSPEYLTRSQIEAAVELQVGIYRGVRHHIYYVGAVWWLFLILTVAAAFMMAVSYVFKVYATHMDLPDATSVGKAGNIVNHAKRLIRVYAFYTAIYSLPILLRLVVHFCY